MDEPRLTVWLDGAAEIEKSFVVEVLTTSVTVAERLKLPLVPVTVSV